MSKEHDLFEYLNLASNVGQNLQLGGIESQLKLLVDGQIRATQLQASLEALKSNHAEQQRAIRNLIWMGMQGLENAKKLKIEKPDKPILFAYALELCTLPISTNDCDDWEDKKRLQSFCDELDVLKQEAKGEIGDNKFNDIEKSIKAQSCLESLDVYIRLRKCLEGHDETVKLLRLELDALNRQKANVRSNSSFFNSLMESAELDEKIKAKASKLEKLREKSPFESDPLFEPLFREKKPPSASWDGEIAMRAYRQWLDGVSEIVNQFFGQLSDEFNSRSHNSAVQYRAELLEATMRFYEFDSVAEAEEFILNRDKTLQSDEAKEDTKLTSITSLMRQHEKAGDFAKAKDALYDLIDADPADIELYDVGMLFYQRLIKLSDEALMAGNLPRSEVNAGLDELSGRRVRLTQTGTNGKTGVCKSGRIESQTSGNPTSLSDEVRRIACDPARKIEAIKLHQKQAAIGLADAKFDVEEFIKTAPIAKPVKDIITPNKICGETRDKVQSQSLIYGNRGLIGLIAFFLGIAAIVGPFLFSNDPTVTFTQSDREAFQAFGIIMVPIGSLFMLWGYWKYGRKTIVKRKS